jgi:nucleoside-diphosphate-sugar epimerase
VKVLITGVTGFIGSHVARLALAQGHEVAAVVSPGSARWRIRDLVSRLTLIEQDLGEVDRLRKRLAGGRPDLCLHLAWRGWSGSLATVEENITSLSASLEFMRAVAELGCPRFVAAGTCFEYDTTHPLLTETTPTQPHDLYGTCKRALFQVAEQFSRLTKMAIAWPRIFYSYGPYEDRRRLVPSIVLALLRGEPAATTSGEQVRDYLHVEDIASAIWTVALSDFTGAVNIASGTPITLKTIIHEIGRRMGCVDRLQIGALPYREGEPMLIRADASLLRTRFAWTPRFDLETGIAQTIDWWRGQVASGR